MWEDKGESMMVYIIIFDSTTKMAADISLRFNCYVYTLRQHTHKRGYC